jgi:hypothetical protein
VRDIWNIIGALAGVVAIGVTIYIFAHERSSQVKRFEVAVLARSILIDEKLSQAQRRLEIRYNGEPIHNLVLFKLRVANVGEQPLRGSDFESAIYLDFDHISKLMAADASKAQPDSLQVVPHASGNRVEVAGTLMNPGDWYSLDVSVVPNPGQEPLVRPTARIAGVKEIEFRDAAAPREPNRWSRLLLYPGILLLVPAAVQLLSSLRMLRRSYGTK